MTKCVCGKTIFKSKHDAKCRVRRKLLKLMWMYRCRSVDGVIFHLTSQRMTNKYKVLDTTQNP